MAFPSDNTITLANTVACTAAEGPGKRYAIWVQGCPLDCPGCCNQEMLPFVGGNEIRVSELVDWISRSQKDNGIKGITLLGGEPFSQMPSLVSLLPKVQSMDLSVMIFSGYTLAELHQLDGPTVEVLSHTDILVDGRYHADQPDTTRRWIGSRNQRIHFLSDRYAESDAYWDEPDTLELRWNDGELSVNGFPAKRLFPLWARPARPITPTPDEELDK